MTEKLAIFARALKKQNEDNPPDPFEVIADLISDLQFKIKDLESKVLNLELKAKSTPQIRKIHHIRDPQTHQIVSSEIVMDE